MTGLELGALAGLGLAALGAFLPWASVAATSFTAWDQDLRDFLLFAAAFSASFAIDAILVLLIAAIGSYSILAGVGALPALPQPEPTKARMIALLMLLGIVVLPLFKSKGAWWQGVCIAVLGAFELVGVTTLEYTVGLSRVRAVPEYGLYLTVLGGVMTAFCGFMFSRQVTGSGSDTSSELGRTRSHDEEELWQ